MKETLYLLPGLLCDRALWMAQIESLSDKYGIRVADFTKGQSVEEFAASVLDDAPETFSVAGLSMGGYVAFELLRQVPDRIKRVALIDTSPYADEPEHKEFRHAIMEVAKTQGMEEVVETLLGRLIHPSRFIDKDLVRSIDAMAHRIGVEGFIRQQTALLNRQSSEDLLPEIKCPTLIVVGKQDKLTPPKISRDMAQKITHSKLIEIDNCAHMSTMEQPEALSALLHYWMQG